MAVEFHNVTSPTIGKTWAFIIRLFEDWITDDTKAMFGSAEPIGKLITFGYTTGDDGVTYNITSADIAACGVLPPAYILNCPGWRRMPKLLAEDYGSNDVKTVFESVIKALREEILEEFVQFNAITWTATEIDFDAGVTSTRYLAPCVKAYIQAVDALLLQRYSTDYEKELLDDEPTMDGILALPSFFPAGGGGGGGGGEDLVPVLTEIRDAVREIAERRIDIDINDGETKVSVTGALEDE